MGTDFRCLVPPTGSCVKDDPDKEAEQVEAGRETLGRLEESFVGENDGADHDYIA